MASDPFGGFVPFSGCCPDPVPFFGSMDQPSNPNYPTYFYTRADEGMGASFTYDVPRTIDIGKSLTLRYALSVHDGKPSMDDLNRKGSDFAAMKVDEHEPRIRGLSECHWIKLDFT